MSDYEHVVVDDLPDAPGPSDHKKEIDEAIGCETIAANFYVAQPGQRLPFGYHGHAGQEELFYVVDGRVVFDTEDGDVTVEAGEAFFVPPEHFQGSRAAGDDPARVLAIGAPRDALGVTIREPCPACGEVTERDVAFGTEDGDRVATLTCSSCGAETDQYTPGPEQS
jgi:uncharacterized cupin superfamily protein